jgi:TolB protein
MDVDGKNNKQLTSGSSVCTSPAFSPDGKKIVFIADGNVYSVDVDGKDVRQLTSDGAAGSEYFNPVFTKDGKIVCFAETTTGSKMRMMDPDGKNIKLLSHTDYWKLVSPDGKNVVTTALNGFSNKDEIHMVDINTETKRKLAEGAKASWFIPLKTATGLN